MPTMTNRDLASVELWQHSLEQARLRRALAENARKDQSRRKTASLAVSAAMVASPMLPSAAGSGSGKSLKDTAKRARALGEDHRERVLLSFGDITSAVREVQEALHIPADGMFGPQTRAAVRAFQVREKLPVSG